LFSQSLQQGNNSLNKRQETVLPKRWKNLAQSFFLKASAIATAKAKKD